MAPVDGGDKGIFDRDEGCRVELFGEFAFGCIIAENSVGLAWMGTC